MSPRFAPTWRAPRSRSTREELDHLKAELGTLESLEGRLVEWEMPSVLRDETTELERQLLAVHERARRDPLGAAEESKRFALPLSTFLGRTGRLVQAVSQLRGEVRQRRGEASAALERLRGEGLAVEEAGFEPDAMLSYIDRRSAEALRAVKAGRDEEALASMRRRTGRTVRRGSALVRQGGSSSCGQ
jgi:hypothetical protein